jgi:type VI secretion system protein ImpM
MTLPFKRAAGALPEFSIFGKLPQRGDFIRVNATHPGAMYLDDLIARSLQKRLVDTAAIDAYRAMPASCVVLRHGDGLFLGALMPSQDQAGRHYPLAAGTFLTEGEARYPLALLLLAKELFFSGLHEQLVSAHSNSVEMLACRHFLEEQAMFNLGVDADLDLARQLLERHMQCTTVADLNALLNEAEAGCLDSVLMSFVFHKPLLRKFANSLPSQLFLLPLPDRDGEDMLHAALWLSLYQAATESDTVRTEQFFLLNQNGRRYLALVPGRLTDQHFTLCWGCIPNPGTVFDFREESTPWRGDRTYAEASYVLGRRLGDQSLSIAELRSVLRNILHSIG